MSHKNILFFVNSIRKGNGGVASIIELADNLSLNTNYIVYLCILNLDPFYLKSIKIFKKDFPNSKIKILYIPGYKLTLSCKKPTEFIKLVLKGFIRKLNKNYKQQIKSLIEALLILLNTRKIKKFEEIIFVSDIIIKAIPLKGDELTGLRKKTNALIIQNHAGSVEAFEKFWIKEDQLPKNYNINYSQYVNFCLSFDKLLFQSEEQAKECYTKHKELIDKIIVINPTCNESDVLSAKKKPSPYLVNAKVIINVGTIQPRKAQHKSIEAFACIAEKFPDTQLHFVGSYNKDDQYYKSLRLLIRRLNLENRIFFHGHRDDYLRFMVHAYVLIQTSDAEGIPRVFREAMFMKLPILCFNLSGMADFLVNYREALFVEKNSIVEFSKSLEMLLYDSGFAKKIAIAAYNKYLIQNSNKIYSEIVNSKFADLNKK